MEIYPALTPAEWAEFLTESRPDGMDEVGQAMQADRARRVLLDAAVTARRYHAAGALALHGQRFGFTWEDVDRLRALAAGSEPREEPGDSGAAYAKTEAWAVELAERIAALLPPRS